MSPGAEINDRTIFVDVEVLADREHAIQLRDRRLKDLFEPLQFSCNLCRWRSTIPANLHPGFLESWFAPKNANITRFRCKPLHKAALPLARKFDRGFFALVRSLRYSLKKASEILPQLGTVRVPIRHPGPREACPVPGRPI